MFQSSRRVDARTFRSTRREHGSIDDAPYFHFPPSCRSAISLKYIEDYAAVTLNRFRHTIMDLVLVVQSTPPFPSTATMSPSPLSSIDPDDQDAADAAALAMYEMDQAIGVARQRASELYHTSIVLRTISEYSSKADMLSLMLTSRRGLQDVGPVMYRMVDVGDLLRMRQTMPSMVSAGNNLPLSRW